jgi:hypothetical protein
VDAIASNAFLAEDGGYELFDQEWSLSAPMPKSWFILRNIFSIGPELRKPWPHDITCLTDLYNCVSAKLGVEPDLVGGIRLDAQFSDEVMKSSFSEAREDVFLMGMDAEFPPSYPRDPAERTDLRIRLVRAHAHVQHLEAHVGMLDVNIQELNETISNQLDRIHTLESENERASKELASRAYRIAHGMSRRLRKIPGMKKLLDH